MHLIQVALPVPLGRVFDYLLPPHIQLSQCPIGVRVKVPFGPRQLIGIVYQHANNSEFDPAKLRCITDVLEQTPIIEPRMLQLLERMSRYYHHPIGEILSLALPPALRKGKIANIKGITVFQATASGQTTTAASLKGHKRQALLEELQQGPKRSDELGNYSTAVIKALIERGLIEKTQAPCLLTGRANATPPTLTDEQTTVINAIQPLGEFAVHLLQGVTGSGKTEVYIRLIEHVLRKGQQALVLVPEIGLTPQTIRRFAERLNANIAVIHSNLNDSERLDNYLAAFHGDADLVIGTRSALFCSLPRLALIIVDEEHDAAYKQQDSCRFHARDMAVYRAKLTNIPILLGSATPSLESIYHARNGHYQLHKLTERAKGTQLPRIQFLDMKQQRVTSGISDKLRQVIEKALERGHQIMLFLNRRGYAPVLMCHDCGWFAHCQRCDSHYTFHVSPTYLHCHHCDAKKPVPTQCPECHSSEVIHIGQGTGKIEHYIRDQFPQARVVRIDRDTTRRKEAFATLLPQINNGDFDILIGTQMLAKGHHFPKLRVVAILDIDASLFSSDFRAPEQLAQLVNQVSGRAGRESDRGLVLLQTHHPDHPLLQLLLNQDFDAFCTHELEARKAIGFPPYLYQALLRGEGHQAEQVEQALIQLKQLAAHPQVQSLGPIPAPIGKRAGFFRYQLLLQSSDRSALHQVLSLIETSKQAKNSRVKLIRDIDPLDMM